MTAIRVGIVSWNTADLLDHCLAALPAALGGLDAEVVVVDNASSDSSGAVARRHHDVAVVVHDGNLGYARAMNHALSGSSAPVLIALNPDTVPAPGSLKSLAERLEQDPELGLVVPRLRNPDGSVQHSVYRFPSPAVAAAVSFVPPRWQHGRIGQRYWLEGASPHDHSTDIDWAIGAVHAMRADALQGADPYSLRWFMYVEDLDLCWRLHQRGWRCRLEVDAEVIHVGNAAGSQAWGSDRRQRWLPATYDWYDLAKGRGARRRWAALNAVGSSVDAAVYAAGAVQPRHRARRLGVARSLAEAVPIHWHALMSDVVVPAGAPPR
ncbi:MAG TPA: glycosyltransferase family 2 protein [Acidimicrobiales bacterium]|jgi:N-acetylglucosaminyl-diphospho-decaprenol L-rhamnosyltransferase|nr:glycosyltransferase family 2 protein [Acidimicrobiales bacterium]